MRASRLRLTRATGLLVCIALLGSSESVSGDTFPLTTAVPHSIPAPLQPQLQTLLQQHADILYTYLLLRTDEADRVCGLADAEISKLELAAKGAVQHALDDWLAAIALQYSSDPDGNTAKLLTRQIGGQAGGGVIIRQLGDGRRLVVKDGKPVGMIQAGGKEIVRIQADGLQIRGAGIQFRGDRFMAGGFAMEGLFDKSAKDPEAPSLNLEAAQVGESSVWRATLDRILTEDKRTRLMRLRTRRESLPNESQLDQMLRFLDNELLFDERQRERIIDLCRQFLSDRSSSLEGRALAQMALDSFSAVELADLLSKRQLMRRHEWTRKANFPAFDAFRPNVIWEGDVPQPARPRLGF